MSRKLSLIAIFAVLILGGGNAYAFGGWSSGSSDSAMSGSSGIRSDGSSSASDELGPSDYSSDSDISDTTRGYYGSPETSDTPAGETSFGSMGPDSDRIPSENDSHEVGSELMDENPLEGAGSSSGITDSVK